MERLRLLVIPVILLLMAAPVMAAPQQQSGGYCNENGQWCYFDPSGMMRCEASGQCESEGEEEEGGGGCTPGSELVVITCEGEEATFCFYTCNDEGGWEASGCLPGSSDDCVEGACYREEEGSDPICWELPGNETPCEDLNWSEDGLQCLNQYGLSVSVQVPCQLVGRRPYPRGMVVVPNQMWITSDSPSWVEAWSETLDYDECGELGMEDGGRMVRNFRFGLAWGRMEEAPAWVVEESGTYRGWSIGGVVWERASWGKPYCGPSLTPGEKLPSYRVNVWTYWTAYWRRVYERQRMTNDCIYAWQCDYGQEVPGQCDFDGDGSIDPCWIWSEELCDDDENGDGIPDDHCWEERDSGWIAFDLTEFGYPTPYFVSSAAGPQPTYLEPTPGCGQICVPVIEVQGVIRDPRR